MGEFQDKDRVLHWRPLKNGPALPGVQPGSLLLILKGVFGMSDAPPKWCEKISKVLVQIGFKTQRMCLGVFTMRISKQSSICNRGANLRAKQKLLRKHKEACKSSWSQIGSLKSFTLTIPWNLAKLVKISPGIIARLHHHRSETNGIAERAVCAE